MSWAEYILVVASWVTQRPRHHRKVGGLWFFRLGRLGGSIYWAKGPRKHHA
jgi:hypothetical protein